MWVTASVAMLPAAPGLTSTRNCWPSFSDRNWAIRRATISDALPAAWPTMIFTGRDGYACALTEAGSTAAPAARCRNRLRHRCMGRSPAVHSIKRQPRLSEPQIDGVRLRRLPPLAALRARLHHSREDLEGLAAAPGASAAWDADAPLVTWPTQATASIPYPTWATVRICSIRLDARGLDDPAPLLDFARDVSPELGGRHQHRLCTQARKLRLYGRIQENGMVGSKRTALIALLRSSMISTGVFAGAP